MLKEFFDKIAKSEVMIKIQNAINNFIDGFSLSGVKERVDNFVD